MKNKYDSLTSSESAFTVMSKFDEYQNTKEYLFYEWKNFLDMTIQ